jgi:hypothetical protein
VKKQVTRGKISAVWLHLHEVLRIFELIKMESGTVVSGGEEAAGVLFYKMESSGRCTAK